MKKITTCFMCTMLVFASCKKNDESIPNVQPGYNPGSVFRYSGSDYSQHIPKDTAEKMIESYLLSINFPTINTDIRHFIFNADSMRNFLSNSNIATLKFMLAHRKTYSRAGYFGVNAGTAASALTFLVAGLDEEDDDYIYASGNQVYDLRTSERIPFDTANTMISSYLTSINYTQNSVSLQSMTFDADTMRGFLNNAEVKELKFIMAHRDTYIKNSFGSYCGTGASGLTFVIVGLSATGEIIYTKNDMVMEHTRPCPSFCNTSALLTQ